MRADEVQDAGRLARVTLRGSTDPDPRAAPGHRRPRLPGRGSGRPPGAGRARRHLRPQLLQRAARARGRGARRRERGVPAGRAAATSTPVAPAGSRWPSSTGRTATWSPARPRRSRSAMTVRVDGRAVPVAPAALAAAFPGTGGRLAVFLHGLTETEDSWGYGAERHHGDPAVTYGSQLQRDLGLTPVYLRYNTGLHISENGRSLDALLGALVDGVAGAGAGRRPRSGTPWAGWSPAARCTRPAAGRRRRAAGPGSSATRSPSGSPAPRARRWSAASTGSTAQLARLPETAAAGPAADPAQRRDQGPPPRHPGRGRLDRPRPRRAHARRAHPRAAARRRPALRRPRDAEPQPRGPDWPTCSATCSCRRAAPAATPGTTTGSRSRPTTCTASAACTTSTCSNHPLVYARIRAWLEERPEGPRPPAPEDAPRTWTPAPEREVAHSGVTCDDAPR